MNFSQSTIKGILKVLGNGLVYPCLVPVSWLQALRDMLSVPPIVSCVNLIILAPPLRVNDRIKTCRAGSFFFPHMRVINLKSLLRAIPWDVAWNLFRALTSPGRGCLLHDIDISCFYLMLNMGRVISGRSWPIWGHFALWQRHWVEFDSHLLKLAWVPWMFITRALLTTTGWHLLVPSLLIMPFLMVFTLFEAGVQVFLCGWRLKSQALSRACPV